MSLGVRAGEVHALVGQNGSGKSTLVKVFAGYHAPDSGEVLIEGAAARRTSGMNGRVQVVHQELGLVAQMSVADNLGLQSSYATGRARRISWRQQTEHAEQLLAEFGVRVDLSRPLSECTPGDRAVVAIVAALQGLKEGGGILLLDEPTALLPPHETAKLLAIIRDLRAEGIGVLYISHRLDEVFAVADRVSVLRDGRLIVTEEVSRMTKQRLVDLMLGEALEVLAAKPDQPSERKLVVDTVRMRYRGDWAEITLGVTEGEVVGIAGLAGSGREQLPYALAKQRAGAGRSGRGDDRLSVAFVPPDRSVDGIIRQMSVAENLTLSSLGSTRSWGRISADREDKIVADWIGKLGIVTAGSRAALSSLSGGNQQKVLLARCLEQELQLLVMAEPTAGVDVGARQTIHETVHAAVQQGLAVVIASTDIAELAALCHRVIVLSDGQIAQVLEGATLSEESVLHALEGAT